MTKPLALYARVSTPEQSVDAQLDALHAYAEGRDGDEHGDDRDQPVVFVDHGVSGGKDRRPALDELRRAIVRRQVRAVVVTKLDRLARSVRHLTTLAADMEAAGVDLVVLDQAIDTGTATGRLLFHVLGAVGEFERDLIRDRTRAGLAAARRRGVRLGRPRALDDHTVARIRRLRAAGRSTREVARIVGKPKSTVARVKP